jgi:urease accessory protein
MRKTTNKGTDVALTLETDTILRNGDILYWSDDRMIVVEQEPENVAVLTFKDENATKSELFHIAVELGHTVGNLHRPIKVKGEKVYVPIQADSEIELLNRLLEPILDHLTITTERLVFEPEEGLHTHEH